jgi:hypothetical protein
VNVIYYDAIAIQEKALQPSGVPVLTGQHKGGAGGFMTNGHGNSSLGSNQDGSCRRDVWTINSEPFPEQHYACFQQKLVEPCILAGTSEKGCCAECGAP